MLELWAEDKEMMRIRYPVGWMPIIDVKQRTRVKTRRKFVTWRP